ncbi:MAG: hypothetical protein LIP12_01110 [Clostridiales bacterium]|nr:hypothetical protein [Clostridiales bacterium]
MDNNKFILEYLCCADVHIRPEMDLRKRRSFLRRIPLREFFLCIYLARKQEDINDVMPLMQLENDLYECHVIEESETEVQIAGYESIGDVASSFYIRFFYVWKNHLDGFSEKEKSEFFALAAVLPFYYYKFQDDLKLPDEWGVCLDGYLEQIGIKACSGKMSLSDSGNESDALIDKYQQYLQRSGLADMEQPNINELIGSGYDLARREKEDA